MIENQQIALKQSSSAASSPLWFLLSHRLWLLRTCLTSVPVLHVGMSINRNFIILPCIILSCHYLMLLMLLTINFIYYLHYQFWRLLVWKYPIFFPYLLFNYQFCRWGRGLWTAQIWAMSYNQNSQENLIHSHVLSHEKYLFYASAFIF